VLAVLVAVAMIWQGVEAARGAFPCRPDVQASVATAASMAAYDLAADLCADSDCNDHMQHHATAALDAPLTVGVRPRNISCSTPA
jgi:hypothetical protein